MNRGLLPLLPLALGLSGCIVEAEHAGPTRTERAQVARDDSRFLTVNLTMRAGELRLAGGGSRFLDGDFVYNVEAWKPTVRYTTAAGRGHLAVTQPEKRGRLGRTRYIWDLQLPKNIPTDLDIRFGAGDAKLNLADMTLRNVDIEMGVGEIELDLRGDIGSGCNVRIRGGVGEATVRLPREAGILAKAHGGIGSIEVRGLRRSGGRWVSDAYDEAANRIVLDVHGGIGQINLIAD